MAKRFNPAPGWPEAPQGWLPYDGWVPDADWPPAPTGWPLVKDDSNSWSESGFAQKLKQASRELQSKISAPADAAAEQSDVLWSAKGQPITGIGGGRYRLTVKTLFFETGTITTKAQQVPTSQLFDIDMRQSLTQKARGVGDVIVHINRADSVEIAVLHDIPNSRAAVSAINDAAHQARLEVARIANTHHYSAENAPAQKTPTEAINDPMKQLADLGKLRDAGVLTEEEFTSKKAEILARMWVSGHYWVY